MDSVSLRQKWADFTNLPRIVTEETLPELLHHSSRAASTCRFDRLIVCLSWEDEPSELLNELLNTFEGPVSLWGLESLEALSYVVLCCDCCHCLCIAHVSMKVKLKSTIQLQFSIRVGYLWKKSNLNEHFPIIVHFRTVLNIEIQHQKHVMCTFGVIVTVKMQFF